jgi:hypothetical protein
MKNAELIQEIYQTVNSLRAEMKEELQSQLKPIKEDVAEIKKNYVLRVDFEPVKRVVYGAVGVMLFSVLTSLIYMVLKR